VRRLPVRPQIAAAVLVVVGLVGGIMFVAGGGDDDDDADRNTTPTSMETGGIEVAAPDGWLSIPLPMFGFGLAVPPGWEATRLDEEALSSIGQADPLVPDFAAAAHNAYTNGSVFYAAGVDQQQRVSDLKVGADLTAGVKDAAGLEAYAQQLAAALADPHVEVVEGAANPTVDIRFRGQGTGSAGEVTVEGTQRLVLSPRGIVFSLIMTSEDPATHDDVAGQLFGTFTLGEGA
jgi:hypothetical protein